MHNQLKTDTENSKWTAHRMGSILSKAAWKHDFEDQSLYRAFKDLFCRLSKIRHIRPQITRLHRKSWKSLHLDHIWIIFVYKVMVFRGLFPRKNNQSTWLCTEERHQAQDQRGSESSGQRWTQQAGAVAVALYVTNLGFAVPRSLVDIWYTHIYIYIYICMYIYIYIHTWYDIQLVAL